VSTSRSLPWVSADFVNTPLALRTLILLQPPTTLSVYYSTLAGLNPTVFAPPYSPASVSRQKPSQASDTGTAAARLDRPATALALQTWQHSLEHNLLFERHLYQRFGRRIFDSVEAVSLFPFFSPIDDQSLIRWTVLEPTYSIESILSISLHQVPGRVHRQYRTLRLLPER
jgi:hypothetical protein